MCQKLAGWVCQGKLLIIAGFFGGGFVLFFFFLFLILSRTLIGCVALRVSRVKGVPDLDKNPSTSVQ